jgi:hypothetical protein
MATIEIPYHWAGVDGGVRVEMSVNDDPAALGCPDLARGFPYCRATVHPGGIGYDHRYGWVQLVDGTHQSGGFHVDQHPAYENRSPFLCDGYPSDFFDGPHTDMRDWDFLAHTFLCGKGGTLHEMRKEARAILGFRWGFSKRDQQIEWFGPEPLSAQDWDAHLERMEEERPEWSFRPGFSQHPLEP